MSRAARLACAGLGLAALLAAPAGSAPHPSHRSRAEAEYDSATKRLEVALSISPFELERALSRRHGKRVDLERTPDVERLVSGWLARRFPVVDGEGEARELSWVGMEVSVKVAWLYFEVPLPRGVEGVRVASLVLLDEEPEQENTVVFSGGEEKTTLSFDRDDREKKPLRGR